MSIGPIDQQQSDLQAVLEQLRLAGISPPPAPDLSPAPTFQPTPGQRLLEGFAGMQPTVRPTSFAAGLVGGLQGALGSAGSRIAAQREAFDQAQAQKRAAADAERLAATKTYQSAVLEGLRGAAKDRAAAAAAAAKLASEQKPPEPTPYKIRGIPATRKEYIDYLGKQMSSTNAGTLTPEAQDFLATVLRQTGTLGGISLGRGGIQSPVGAGIINKAATMPGPGLAEARGAYMATTGALRGLETALSQQSAFASTLKRNSDMLRGTAKKVADLGTQYANRPVRSVLGRLGSTDIAAYNASLLPVQTESARLLSAGPALGGQLTDAARRELEHVISGDFTSAQLTAVLDILDRDAANRIKSYREQRDQLRKSLSGQPAPVDPSQFWEP